MKFSMLIPVGHGAAGEFQSAAAIAVMAKALEAANIDACFLNDHPAPSAEWHVPMGTMRLASTSPNAERCLMKPLK